MPTVKATIRKDNKNGAVSVGKGEANKLTSHGARTIELAAATQNTIVDFQLTIPSNSRIAGCSRMHNDDLAASGSPTFAIGLFPVNGNFTAVDNALTDSVALSTASTANVGAQVVKDFANYGKKAWELAGLSSDPGGDMAVMGTVKDAATDTTGTITLDLYTVQD